MTKKVMKASVREIQSNYFKKVLCVGRGLVLFDCFLIESAYKNAKRTLIILFVHLPKAVGFPASGFFFFTRIVL